jgi:hypothetical protein
MITEHVLLNPINLEIINPRGHRYPVGMEAGNAGRL